MNVWHPFEQRDASGGRVPVLFILLILLLVMFFCHVLENITLNFPNFFLLSISDVRGQVLFFGSLQGPLVLVRG